MAFVSAIIIAKEHENSINEAVLSAINQSVKIDELIIIDDNSKDNTWNMLHGLAQTHHQIKLSRNQSVQGQNKSIAKALKMTDTRTDIIFFQNPQAISDKHRLKKQLSALKGRDDVDLIGSQVTWIDELQIKQKTINYPLTITSKDTMPSFWPYSAIIRKVAFTPAAFEKLNKNLSLRNALSPNIKGENLNADYVNVFINNSTEKFEQINASTKNSDISKSQKASKIIIQKLFSAMPNYIAFKILPDKLKLDFFY